MNHIERELRMKQGNLRELYNDILSGLVSEMGGLHAVRESSIRSDRIKFADLNWLYKNGDLTFEEFKARARSLGSDTSDAIVESFTDGLDRSADRLKTKVEETVTENVTDATNDTLGIPKTGGVSEVFEDSGEDVIDGFMSGTDNKAFDLNEYMSKYAQTNVVDPFNDTLDINSPSKVMAESGKYTIMGIIKGLTDTTSKLDKATGGIGTKLIQAFSTPLDIISGLMDGSIEYDPSIKPVVDPSDVTKSAASINSAFQTESFDIGKFSGTLAADINTLRRNDESLITELRALREDVNDMTDEIANMQMVLDTGVLVGEISSQVDYSLGTASIRKKRGI